MPGMRTTLVLLGFAAMPFESMAQNTTTTMATTSTYMAMNATVNTTTTAMVTTTVAPVVTTTTPVVTTTTAAMGSGSSGNSDGMNATVVTTTQMTDGETISGSWAITVSNPQAILDNVVDSAGFAMGVKNTLSGFVGLPTSLIDVALSLGSRRLRALLRKLTNGAINAAYVISVPSSMTGMADAAMAALAAVSVDDIVGNLTAALAVTMTNPPTIVGVVATNPTRTWVTPAPTPAPSGDAPTPAPATTEEPAGDGAQGKVALALPLITSVLAALWLV